MYKEIDSAQFMASGILDLSQDGGPENIYVIANPEYSDNEDALTQIALMNGTIQLQVDSEQEDKFTLLQMTRDNVLLGCTDFEMDGNKSFLDINKEFLGLSYETDLSFTSVNADSQSVNISYMDSLSSSDQNSHGLTLSNEGIEMRNGDATDLYQEILFSMDNGWEYRGKDQSSQTFTIRDSSFSDLFYLKNDGQAYFDGDVGIGTSSPSEKLHVDGNILASGSITENSDRKLKTDIQTLQNALAKVLSLRGVSYNWEDPEKDNNTQLGLIAQEVEKVYPELVKMDKEGNRHLRYTGLIAPLIEAMRS
ncbi:MAG: tail fiber domain-containing protein [Chitinophagales bacterium]